MNDTPKTDSHLKALRDEGAYTDPTAVSVDFARDLERENTKLLAAMTWIRIEAEKHPEIGCRIILEIANKALATAKIKSSQPGN